MPTWLSFPSILRNPLWRGVQWGTCYRRVKGGQDAEALFSPCSVDFLSLPGSVTDLGGFSPKRHT